MIVAVNFFVFYRSSHAVIFCLSTSIQLVNVFKCYRLIRKVAVTPDSLQNLFINGLHTLLKLRKWYKSSWSSCHLSTFLFLKFLLKLVLIVKYAGYIWQILCLIIALTITFCAKQIMLTYSSSLLVQDYNVLALFTFRRCSHCVLEP